MGETQDWTAGRLMGLVRDRYPANEWVLLEQVREGTGFGNHRTADAIAMNLWPSRGLALHGFELKVDRRDWLRELAQPEKAEAIARMCDAWWIVAPKDVVHLGELPAGWGLLTAGKKLVATRAAEIRKPGSQVDRSFVAAVLRRAREVVSDNDKLRDEHQRGFDEGMKAGGKLEAREVLDERRRADALHKSILDFESASGVRICSWNAGEVGGAVRLVVAGENRVTTIRRELEELHARAQRIAAAIELNLKELEHVG